MPLKFRAKDGQEYPLDDRALLRELLAKGVITKETLLYEEDKDAWTAASLHPETREWFAALPGDAPPASVHPHPPDGAKVVPPPPRPGGRRAWLLWAGAAVLLLLAILFLLFLELRHPKPRETSAGPWAGKREHKPAIPAPAVSGAPASTAPSPEELAAAQVEQEVRARLETDVASLVSALNQADIHGDVAHPERLGTSWGLQTFRGKLGESTKALAAFQVALEGVRQEMIAAMNAKDISPVFKGNYAAGLSDGSIKPQALADCEDLAGDLNDYLAAAGALLQFMATASCTATEAGLHFTYPADQDLFDRSLTRTREALDRAVRRYAELRTILTTAPPFDATEVAGAKGETREKEVPAQQPAEGQVTLAPVPPGSEKGTLRPGQVANFDCTDGRDTFLVFTDVAGGKSEAVVSSKEVIQKYLAARAGKDARALSLQGEAGAAPDGVLLELSSSMGLYHSDVTFDDGGIFAWANKKKYLRVPCQPGGIGVICLKGAVAVHVVK